MTTPDGRTPRAPDDVDQPDGNAHAGEDEGRTPATPDQAEGDDPDS